MVKGKSEHLKIRVFHQQREEKSNESGSSSVLQIDVTTNMNRKNDKKVKKAKKGKTKDEGPKQVEWNKITKEIDEKLNEVNYSLDFVYSLLKDNHLPRFFLIFFWSNFFFLLFVTLSFGRQ